MWKGIDYLQILGRLHRQPQNLHVVMYHFQVQKTAEERVYKASMDKLLMHTVFLSGQIPDSVPLDEEMDEETDHSCSESMFY
jgi:superfamily II DNA or RNA helicase